MSSRKRRLSCSKGTDLAENVSAVVDERSAHKRRNTDGLEEDPKLSNLLNLISRIAALSPAHKGLCWLGQVYALSNTSKTWVDSALEKLREEKLVRTFHTNLGVALMLNDTYISEVKIARRVTVSSLKERNVDDGVLGYLDVELEEALSKFIVFLERSSMCSVTHKELTSEYGFKVEEVLRLKLSGFLLNRRDVDVEEVYWIYWPFFASVITDLTETRSRLIAAIKRSRFKEVPASVLEKLISRKEKDGTARKTAMQYYALDLVGSKKVREIVTPGGKSMFRLQ